MIAWSNTKLRFTSGIGALCTAGLLADVSRQTIPVWLAIMIALLPLVIFVFIRSDEMPRSVALPLQVFGSLWHLFLAVILSVAFFRLPERSRGWPVYFIGLAIGCIPCVIILWRSLCHQKDQRR
jgi:FtsH-binding integral membrane protein